MEKIILFILLMISMHCFAHFAQDTAYYKASNGITYKIYDEVKLGKGSGGDGNFIFIQSNDQAMNRIYNNASLKIRSIKNFKAGSTEKILFEVRDRRTWYNVVVEDAIDAAR